MIPNIVQGERMAGLMFYLVGEGRANEHADPHLVGGDPLLMSWYSTRDLTREDAGKIARYLDQATSQRETPVPGGHVFHCSLSLPEREGTLDDAEWEKIATEFMDRMGIQTSLEEPHHAWVAIRHGLSKNGNDHVHIVANLVRDDGAKANMHYSYRRAQEIARDLEVDFGLEQLESEKSDRSERGYKAGEREANARRQARSTYISAHGNDPASWTALSVEERAALVERVQEKDLPRHELATRVRGYAQASQSEAEFVRRARRGGLLVRPRYAKGRTDVVTGYSVALRPPQGERAIWFGGGRLARDLTLSRLREGWPDTPQSATEAVEEWNRAAAKRPPTLTRERGKGPSPAQVSADVDTFTRRLLTLSPNSSEWVSVARQTAGVLSAWATATETTPGPVTQAARSLARVGQTKQPRARRRGVNSPALSALAVLAYSTSTRSVDQAMTWMQLSRLAGLVVQSRIVAQQTRLAGELRATTLATLEARAAHAAAAQRQEATIPAAPASSAELDDAARRRRLSLGLGQGTSGAAPHHSQSGPYTRPPRHNEHERD